MEITSNPNYVCSLSKIEKLLCPQYLEAASSDVHLIVYPQTLYLVFPLKQKDLPPFDHRKYTLILFYLPQIHNSNYNTKTREIA
ncbi:hypothetical protein I79_001993 [Cricetulus griseus]|uniref:Uncharacterized protein n=1 Tax=Cricetulus griseus TaxID=10029 RepID=G3GW76_CRIGR|nr:hypothetical protein I79_001993 [Cricetulus griseus]